MKQVVLHQHNYCTIDDAMQEIDACLEKMDGLSEAVTRKHSESSMESVKESFMTVSDAPFRGEYRMQIEKSKNRRFWGLPQPGQRDVLNQLHAAWLWTSYRESSTTLSEAPVKIEYFHHHI